MECKFHNEALSQKQQMLFDNFKAKEKYILRSYDDIEMIRKKHKPT